MTAIAAMTLAATVVSCGRKSAPEATATVTPADELRSKLEAVVAGGKIAFGHDDDPVYGHSWIGDSGRSDVLETVGDYPAVMNWDLGGIEKGDAANLDSVCFARMRSEAIAQDARGGVNAFSWHSVNPIDGLSSWDCSDTTIVSRIVNDSTVNARFRAQVKNVADFLMSLTDADGRRIGVIFRPWHEHTGSWFWWGAAQCSTDDYKSLWAITREVFDSAGVDNVLWAYSPDRVTSDSAYIARYPGDEYVDIMGADVYAYSGENGVEQYRKAVELTLGAAVREASKRGKIAAFTETGLESIPMSDWWTEVLLPVVKGSGAAYVVVWRNAHDKPNHFYAPYPGHASAESFKAFYSDTTTVFARDMQKLNKTCKN